MIKKTSPPHILSFFSLLFLLLFLATSVSAKDNGTIKDNTSIFQDFKGNPATIEEHTNKGKWLLVMYWASNCHICNQEASEYVAFHKRHSGTDATVLGISLDGLAGKSKAEDFINRHDNRNPGSTTQRTRRTLPRRESC